MDPLARATANLLAADPALDPLVDDLVAGLADDHDHDLAVAVAVADLARRAGEVGRELRPRDRMRLLLRLLLADRDELVIAHLRACIDEDELLARYAARRTARIDVHPDGALSDGASDVREVDLEAGAFVQLQAHDVTAGSYQEAVATFGEAAILSTLWDELRDGVRRRKAAARRFVDGAARAPTPRAADAAGRIVLGAVAAEACDERFVVDVGGGLFAVADAAGPTYGGRHEPIAIDAALVALREAIAGAPAGGAEQRLRAAVGRAAAVLDDDRRAYEALAKQAAGTDRLAAALAAVRAHARARHGRALDAFVHHAASLTAVYLHGGQLAVAQVGSARGFRIRAGVVEQLLPDHLLGTVTGDPMLAELHPDTSTRLLGFPAVEVDLRVDPVEPGDVVIILTAGAWRALPADELARVATAAGSARAIVDALAARLPAGARRPATVVAVVA